MAASVYLCWVCANGADVLLPASVVQRFGKFEGKD